MGRPAVQGTPASLGVTIALPVGSLSAQVWGGPARTQKEPADGGSPTEALVLGREGQPRTRTVGSQGLCGLRAISAVKTKSGCKCLFIVTAKGSPNGFTLSGLCMVLLQAVHCSLAFVLYQRSLTSFLAAATLAPVPSLGAWLPTQEGGRALPAVVVLGAAPWAGGRLPSAWPGGPRPLPPPWPGLSWGLSWRGSRPPGWGAADGPTACQVGGGREGTDTCPGPIREGGRAALTPSRDGRLLPEWPLASCSGPAQPGACALAAGTAAWGPAGCCRGHAGPLCLLMVGAGALPPGCSQHVRA